MFTALLLTVLLQQAPATRADATAADAVAAAGDAVVRLIPDPAVVRPVPTEQPRCGESGPWHDRGRCAVAEAEAVVARVRAENVDCEQAMTTYDMVLCSSAHLAWENARMETYFTEALALADEDAKQSLAEAVDSGSAHPYASHFLTDLLASHRQWNAYAELVCRAVGEEYHGGSIRPLMEMGCWIDLTRQRTHVIWRYSLRGLDGGAEGWPEPAEVVGDAEISSMRQAAALGQPPSAYLGPRNEP